MDVDITMIRKYQHPSGAYPASPNYSQYPYCWFRDGSFIAYAMDRAGQHESAAAFHAWAARTVERHASHIEALLTRCRNGGFAEADEFLPARFTVDGEWHEDGWPNFQLDGYGHWLWGLAEHLRLTEQATIPAAWRAGVDLTVRYLMTFWAEPCYDAWEEYRSQLHTATLASVHGGLNAIERFRRRDDGLHEVISDIHGVIMNECVIDSKFVKHIANPVVDASLLWVSTPFNAVHPQHPIMLKTVEEIERTLICDGGVRRYAADTFYGGGAWVLLTAWLGWHYVRLGLTEKAQNCLEWIEQRRDEEGALPEQVETRHSSRRFVDFWSSRWGVSAKPLLWSHAMALVLRIEIGAQSAQRPTVHAEVAAD